MKILRDAPDLSGSQACPSCGATIARDATLCIHCGYNLETGEKPQQASWLSQNRNLVILLAVAGVILLGGAAFFFWPDSPPTPFVPSEPVVAADAAPAESTIAEPAPEEADAEAEEDTSAEDEAARKAEEERLAREAEEARMEAERAAFAAKKAAAEKACRQQLANQSPLYRLGDTVELRRQNGFFHKGELKRFSGKGKERHAIVITPLGEVDVPLESLDRASRLRMDPAFREAYIAHRVAAQFHSPENDAGATAGTAAP